VLEPSLTATPIVATGVSAAVFAYVKRLAVCKVDVGITLPSAMYEDAAVYEAEIGVTAPYVTVTDALVVATPVVASINRRLYVSTPATVEPTVIDTVSSVLFAEVPLPAVSMTPADQSVEEPLYLVSDPTFALVRFETLAALIFPTLPEAGMMLYVVTAL
jgi:hypothetical protein